MAVDWPLAGLIDVPDFVLSGGFGTALATDVPTLYPIAIDGTPFKVEVNQVRRRTLDALRTAAFQGSTPSEASLSTEAAWIRTQRTWRYGAGLLIGDSQDDGLDNLILSQRYLDSWNMEPDSSGEGITMMRRASTVNTIPTPPNVTGRAVSAGTATYAQANLGVYKIDSSGFTACTGLPAVTMAIASDGYTVWAVCFVDGTHIQFYSLTYNSTAFTAMAGGSMAVGNANQSIALFYGNGFLLMMLGMALYSVNSSGIIGSVIDTISTVTTLSSAFCIQIAASSQFFYFSIATAAVSNLPYAIFKIGIDNAGAFTKFTAAMPSLGPSETIGPIMVKQPFMLIGTSFGFRLADIDASGNLSAGPLVRLTNSESTAFSAPYFGVTSFARFQDKILASWSFGTTSERYIGDLSTAFYNNASQGQCGLLVIDLGRFSTDGVPAWWWWWRETTVDGAITARAIVAENQSNPIVFQFGRYYILGTANLISPCSFVTSWYTFGLDAPKTFVDLEFFHDALATGDKIEAYYQIDDDPTWNLFATSNVVGSYHINGAASIGVNTRRLRLAFVLTAGDITQVTTPRLRRFQLRAFPTPRRSEEIIYPIVAHDHIRIGEDEKTDAVMDTRGAYDFLSNLVNVGKPVFVQEGDRSFLARVEKLELQPDHWSMDPGTGQYRFYQGYLIARVVTL